MMMVNNCRIASAIFFLLTVCGALHAQDYVVLGFGFGSKQLKAASLDKFRDTYNAANSGILIKGMDGLTNGYGPMLSVAFRRVAPLNFAARGGWHTLKGIDTAQYQSSFRNISLEMKGFFTEYEMGYWRKDFFLNGLVGYEFRRQWALQSQGQGETRNPLTGNFESAPSTVIYVGTSFGHTKNGINFVGRVYYPVMLGNGSYFFNPDPNRVDNERAYFPGDFEGYLYSANYERLKSNIGGWTFQFVLEIGIPLQD